MKIQLTGSNFSQIKTDVLVIGAFSTPKKQDEKAKTPKSTKTANPPWQPNTWLAELDKALNGALSEQAKREEFSSKPNSTLVFRTHGRMPARAIVVVGLGEEKIFSTASIRAFAANGVRAANAEKASSVALVALNTTHTTVRAIAEGVVLGNYRFTKYLTGDRVPKHKLETCTIALSSTISEQARQAVKLGEAIGQAVCMTRDLVNEPPNIMNAPVLASYAAQVAKRQNIKIVVLNKAQIEKQKMALLLAVNQGSKIEPRFVHMTYTPQEKSKKPIKKLVFIGKGITFDSGGLCIKPADAMVDMKVDMSGAANIVGLMSAVAALKPKHVEVHGIFAATDNMPSGSAYQPGDVFTSLDGKTVEIINTDAEGRLILADALAYARALKPELIVDNATLTGACMVALGHSCSGFYANRDEIAEEFTHACRDAGEQMWRMPLLDDLREQLKSEVADLKHMGSRYGGSITAALFLREFVGDTTWIHCDIAGPVTSDKPKGFYSKGATGHGVLSFLQLIERLDAKA